MSETPVYDAEASYMVKLARPIEFGGAKLSHMPEYRMTGARLTAIVAAHGSAAIASAVLVEASE